MAVAIIIGREDFTGAVTHEQRPEGDENGAVCISLHQLVPGTESKDEQGLKCISGNLSVLTSR